LAQFGSAKLANSASPDHDPSNRWLRGGRMIKRAMIGGLVLAAQILGSAATFAGPCEDGMAAHNRGDLLGGRA
jgi:hypothetical protein